MRLGDTKFSDLEYELEDFETKKAGQLIDRLYSVTLGGSVHSIPNIVNGVAYFCCADKNIYAVDCTNGSRLWLFKTNGIMCGNSAEINDGVLYAGTLSGRLYALDINTGKEIWNYRAGGGLTCKPLFYKDRIIFACLDGGLYCVDINKRIEAWRYRSGGPLLCSPSVYNNRIYFGSGDGSFYCVDADTGQEIWRFRTGDEVYSESPCNFSNGMVFFASVSNFVFAVDAETGREMWRARTGKYGNSGSPVISNDMVYHCSRDGILFVFDLNGREQWRFKAGGLIAVGVTIYKDRVYFGCEDGNLYCTNMIGKEQWRYRTFGQTWCPPTIWNNLAIFGSMDCHLYAVDAETGRIMWSFPTSMQIPSQIDPPYKAWEFEIKKEVVESSVGEDKYKININPNFVDGSEYTVNSEYVNESEYG